MRPATNKSYARNYHRTRAEMRSRPPIPKRVRGIGGTPLTSAPKIGRNDPCPCGSGKKFKNCCKGD